MLTKFETKSNRVKGLAFHPKRPWILASLHSGVIQLWDYRMGTLIDRFAEHDGPVRGVEFHSTQPIFVSGGDDYKVKVWSYKTRRCLFTLTGHLDYIRTVQFHPEHPWIVTASDDQTVRIWNWQSRTCTAVLTGHNHYVMCAGFHPKEDMVVSASLDQTVRVWDISGLRKKSVAPGGDDNDMKADLFGSGDAVVKYVLEGHERGVNWAAFHPTLPMIVSGADDRIVKLWRYNDSKAWVLDALRGHMENVSCVIFNGKQQDLIISNSEDRTIRVWDMSRRAALQTFRREHDRFWILASHPEINLLAAGHDSGMIVFKLARERPPHAVHGTDAYFIANSILKHYDTKTGRVEAIQSLQKANTLSPKAAVARSVSYNPAENAILVNTDEDGGSFKLFKLPANASGGGSATGRGEIAPDYIGTGSTAVFIARNRFAVWDRTASQIHIRNLQNEITKRCAPPDPTCSALFYAGTGMLLCRCEEKMVLFDVQQRVAIAELQVPLVKYVVWNANMTQVALLSKHAIILADAKLKSSTTIHETIRVKSAAWSDGGVLIYTTLNHIKYCLPHGDSGIVRTLDNPVYVVSVVGDTINALDREGKTATIKVEASEYLFKQALAKRDFDTVLKVIRSGKLCGQAIIAFLRKKGFPEVALHFVQDDKARFEIAIECGNIEVALQTAQKLDDKSITHRLGLEAFRHGNLEIVEWCFQQTKAYDKLSFLYAINGNTEKLAKMLKLAEMRGNIMSRYSNALYSGSARARVQILKDAGHTALAYVCAKTHGLDEDAAALAEVLGDNLPEIRPDAAVMMPPTPILRHGNWPLLEVTASMFEGKLAGERKAGGVGASTAGEVLDIGDDDGGGWGDDDLALPGADSGAANGAAGSGLGGDDEEDGGWEMEDLDLPADLPAVSGGAGAGPFVAPPPGQPVTQRWLARSKLAAEHVAAGSFDSAIRMLTLQLGLASFEPLKANMLALHTAAFAHASGLAGLPSISIGIDAAWTKSSPTAPAVHPATPFKLATLEKKVMEAYEHVTKNRLAEAVAAFTAILLMVPLLVVETRKEVDDVKELLSICREYHTGLRCELEARATPADKAERAAELSAYFTHCTLQPRHLAIALRLAMTKFYKAKLYTTCATFCRRLLELNVPEKLATQARQVLGVCEGNPEDAFTINYDPRNPFDLCALTFVPMYRGSKTVACPFTGAKFTPECAGKISPLGDIAKIGADASGLVVSHTQVR